MSREEIEALRAHAAMGEMVEFRRLAERLFVEVARRIIEAEGPQPVRALVADVAFALDISTATAKRYLQKHASRWGEFLIKGEMVLLRRGR